MSKVKIIVSIDYELFGDGSGSVKHCIVEPARKMIEVAAKFRVPLTFMVELCEYLAFKKEEQGKQFPKNEGPFTQIKSQLSNAVKMGHDLQLHIHPQWINYVYQKKANRWRVDLSKWRTSSLSYNELYSILIKGKNELEKLIRPTDPQYKCLAFRAGALSIQPEKTTLSALLDAGFNIDTSIAPEKFVQNKLTRFDFRKSPNKPFWSIKENVLKEDREGKILEIPINTIRHTFAKNIYYQTLRIMSSSRRRPWGCHGSYASASKRSFFKKLIPRHETLNIGTMSGREMLQVVARAAHTFKHYSVIPIVAIGHTKDFANSTSFDYFIRKSIKRGYSFTTFQKIIEDL
jgi:hypothetical protein